MHKKKMKLAYKQNKIKNKIRTKEICVACGKSKLERNMIGEEGHKICRDCYEDNGYFYVT